MVGPPSSWSRDQEDLIGRRASGLSARRVLVIPTLRSDLARIPSRLGPASVPLCQPDGRWDLSPHDTSQLDGRFATGGPASARPTD